MWLSTQCRLCSAHKKTRLAAGSSEIKRSLDGFDRFGLWAFLAFGSDERNTLVFFQRLEARTDDVGVVREQVLATRFRLDETKALFVVEPLYNTSFCLHFFAIPKKTSTMPYRRRSRCRDLHKKKLFPGISI